MNTDILFRALSIKRGAGSLLERGFVAFLARELDADLIDEAGNLHFDRRTRYSNKTLFTAHTDTVHRVDGANEFTVDGDKVSANGSQLGADDGAGIAIIAHMIQSGTPGYYILFRGEECGGIGSNWLAKNDPDMLRQFDRAVAFDRRGTSSVITHQSGGRCASQEFAEALSDALNAQGMLYAPDDTGVYTDTANFTDIIPECTNVSVGYEHEHSKSEWLNLDHLRQLAAAVVAIDWDALPTERDPSSMGVGDLPVAMSIRDHEIEAAFLDAFDGEDYALRQLAAAIGYPDDVDIAMKNFDDDAFTIPNLIDLAEDSLDWSDAINRLADEALILTH